MNNNSKIALALNLVLASGLVWIPACDKAKDGDKPEAKTQAKAEPEVKEVKADEVDNADPHAGMDHGDAKPAEGDTADAVAGGRVDINVDASGYHPETISAPAKSTITLAFTRTTESGCAAELVVESLEIKKDLPLNEVVEVEVEVPETGELGFACGMNMLKGKVVPKA
jgi:Cupredoxin-like domain